MELNDVALALFVGSMQHKNPSLIGGPRKDGAVEALADDAFHWARLFLAVAKKNATPPGKATVEPLNV
ncbi:hypothetical protein ACVWWQ_000124 [Rhodanobacter sp. TND4EL1]